MMVIVNLDHVALSSALPVCGVCGGGGGQFCSQRLLVVTPGQSLHCDIWLKLIAPHFWVSSDGIAQFLPGVFSCRGFAHLSG